MNIGLIGKKIGMTRIFTDNGDSLPVTVLEVSNNRVTQIKKVETDGYNAIQVTYGKQHANRLIKPIQGHFANAGVEAGRVIKEFRVNPEELNEFKAGMRLGLGMFHVGQIVDVTSKSIGKGFSGTIKRHNFSSNRASHGNSKSHNVPGSIGMAQDPGRVFPGKKMSGRLGGEKCTIQNLEILRIDVDRELIHVKGAVPGAKESIVLLRTGIKSKARVK
ncbi:50S ribosomal protein L3 [Nitrosomonas sp. Nm58]|uniref:50S ribosomal protein L3 n=1 Tax=Nitrosomonas sp. Nm58 TaxID=200126 RepID=UPI00089D5057|nr:50S ribosomal protein L3 [Nitrosomonas sp. Nm58]SDZ05477.1 large subunit ribosomal protein L3 [Nitrosomonas sp. Nm58]